MLPTQGAWGLIPGQGTGSHMMQLRVHLEQLKTLHATTKTQRSQIKIFLKTYFQKWKNQEYDANVPLSKKLSDDEIQTNKRWIKDQRNYSTKTGVKQYFHLNKVKTMKL